MSQPYLPYGMDRKSTRWNRDAYFNNVSKRVINIIIEGGAYWKQGTRMKSNQSTEGTMYMHVHLHVVFWLIKCVFGQSIGSFVSQLEAISKEFSKKDLMDEIQKANDFLGM